MDINRLISNRLKHLLKSDGPVEVQCGCVATVRDGLIVNYERVCSTARSIDTTQPDWEAWYESHLQDNVNPRDLFEDGQKVVLGNTTFIVSVLKDPCGPECACAGVGMTRQGKRGAVLFVLKDGLLGVNYHSEDVGKIRPIPLTVDDLEFA